MNIIEDTFTLKDGRRLGYGIYGNRSGFPVIDFHGIPGSRREAALIASYLQRDDLCLIGFDRPGYGRSSPKRAFQINDLPADVCALVDHLGISRFGALGYSGGGPFALACAAQLPERVAALGLVSAVGPADIGSAGMHEANRKKFNMAQRLPWLARAMLWVVFSGLRRNPVRLEKQLRSIWQQMPEPDRQVLAEDERFAAEILAITQDAMLCGVSGWVHEEVMMASPWPFHVRDIHAVPIFLWHGVLDRNVPVSMARALTGQLQGCQAEFVEAEGHISLLYHRGTEIVDIIAQAGRKRMIISEPVS